jgi:hypothetical protein
VGPYDGSRWTRCFEAVCTGRGPLHPFVVHVAVSDSSEIASLGLMMCHGHMASKVAVCHHMA